MNVIYVLRDPRDNAIRYIGISNNHYRRFGRHVKECRDAPHYRARWWRKCLKEAGTTPYMVVFCRIGDLDRNATERFFIASAKYIGLRLTNSTAGGEGSLDPLPEVRARNGASQRKRQPESYDAVRAKMKGVPKPQWWKDKVAAAAKAYYETDAGKAKKERAAQRMKGKNPTAETRAIWSAQRKGKRLTPEAEARRVAKVKGQKRTDETKRRMSEAQKGKIMSATAKALIATKVSALWADSEYRANQMAKRRSPEFIKARHDLWAAKKATSPSPD